MQAFWQATEFGGLLKKTLVRALFFFSTGIFSQSIGVTSPAATGTYCAGTGFNVTYTVSGTFSATNVFSAQISDPTGSFGGTPVTVGTISSTAGGTIACTFPSTLLTSGQYRVRVISNLPAINGSDNGANLTFFSISINSPTPAATSYCRGDVFTVTFSQSSCGFANLPTANVYSVELSNSSGNFNSPTIIGTLTGTVPAAISCTIPSNQASGSGYRIRITTSNPALTSSDNGTNITIAQPLGTPTAFGNGNWLIHCYANRNGYVNNYKGFYTETALSFNSTTRWSATSSPSSANATGGSAYSGCSVPTGTYSFSYKRTNIPCGYYKVDINQHRQEVYMLINGDTAFAHTTCCDAHVPAWTGVIQSTDSIEFQTSAFGGQGYLQVTFTKLNALTVSQPVRVCANTSTTLTAVYSAALPVSFSWTPASSVTSPSSLVTLATPSVSTNYTISAYSGTCAVFTGSIAVTVSAAPAPAITFTNSTICSGQTQSTLNASGGNTYTWLPNTALTATTGYSVIANPTVNTTYTLIASNNCSTLTATRAIVVQTIPATPSPTAFGNNVWNVYCYSASNYSIQYGFYSENSLSFNTTTRWANNSTPSNANAATGTAYQGCTIATGNHALIHKRTNFTCGYYSISLSHDETVFLFVNSVQVFSHTPGPDTDNAAWTGFLGPSSTVELRHSQTGGTSFLSVTVTPVTYPTLSQPVTICAGTNATLTAVNQSGLTYSWTPATNLSTTTGTITVANPTTGINYTCTVTDGATGCTSANSVSVSVNPLPTTSVSPSSSTLNCSAETSTLFATGANSYTWSPSTGLNASTGFSVIASPTVTTIYTVTGSNNCANVATTTTVSVVPLTATTVVPSGNWNAYCFSGTTFTNYYGYFTENGGGTSGYDFTTTARYSSSLSPSSANNTNGNAYLGCALTPTNFSISFRRTGFSCNAYSIQVLGNDDNVTLFINGSQAATRATSTNSNALWTGLLTSTSTVELRLTQTTGTSSLNVRFTPISTNTSLVVWNGSTSTNWFTNSNWCGSSQPTADTDVLIPAGGTTNKPTINNNSGAACRNLTISPAVTSNATVTAIAASSLTIGGSFNFEVYGDWVNNGVFTPGTGTVRFLGTGPQSISSVNTQTFYNLEINTTGPVTMQSGIHRISNNINFINGLVLPTGTLQILNNATATGANDNSYVDGQVTKFGNQSFTFPVGDGGFCRPVGISAPVLTTDNFRAQYFNTDAAGSYNISSKDNSLNNLSRCEYWMLDRTGGTSIVNVTLSWNLNSCGVTNPADLVVSRWDAGQVKWKDHGNGSYSGTTSSGTLISSAPITAFSPFTLGSKTNLNPLPIELVEFTANCNEDGVNLQWKTAAEKNNDYFLLERSTDAIHWLEIGRIAAKPGNGYNAYSSMKHAADGEYYYRLSQVDKNGRQERFPLIYSDCRPSPQNDMFVYPNPAEKDICIEFDLQQAVGEGSLTVTSLDGKAVLCEKIYPGKGRTKIFRKLDLPAGLYLVEFHSDAYSSKPLRLILR